MYSSCQVGRIISSRRLSFATSVLQRRVFHSLKHQYSIIPSPTVSQSGIFYQTRKSLTLSNQTLVETTVPAADKKAKKLIRSKYKDLLVKAGEDVYHLDRLKLALKSGYFEKLLLSPDWNNQSPEPINVPLDSDTFGALVDVIYGASWSSVLNTDNYVAVLKAKDFLQMKNDGYGFSNFISHYLENTPISDVKVFELLKFIDEDGTLQDSLRTIYQYLAKNLEHFHDDEKFLSLPIDHLVEVVKYNESRDWDDDYKEYTYHSYHENRNLVLEVCCKWICHDLENRLPLIVKVANAALEGLVYMRKGNDLGIKIELPDIDEKNKYEVVLRYFKRLLNYGTVVDPGVAVRPEDVREERDKYYCNDFDNEGKEENAKLKEYMENGVFCDITVKVHEKLYKLHRSILESKSGYFSELFSTECAEAAAQCDGIPSLPDKDKEYVIEGIDEATFDFIVDYIYSGGRPPDDAWIKTFKAAHSLKIGQLQQDCKSHIEYNMEKFDSESSIKNVLDCTLGEKECENLYMKYLRRNVMNSWPDIHHEAAFYSISWDKLENWLLSSGFHFDDAEKLLDLCSAWIMHDLKNRYQLIPQVAMSIKRYGLPDYVDYKIKTPADLGSVSQKSIRDQLWDIASSLSLIPASTEANDGEARKFEEWPIFVTSTSGGILDVLNVNFDRMATMSFRKMYMEPFFGRRYPMSAAMVRDNLFIICDIGGHYHFLAYNLPSKKFIELSTDSRIKGNDRLLNCRNELYCCSFENGSMLKYSFELNRWMSFLKSQSTMKKVMFTSDGDKIYRLYQVPGDKTDPTPGYNMESYDFEQNHWTLLSSLSSPLPGDHRSGDESDKKEIVDFTIFNNTHPAVLLKNFILYYEVHSQKWRHLKLPKGQYWFRNNHSVIAQGENGIVQVFNNELHYYSNSKKVWELKKEMEVPNKLMYSESPYYNIVAFNRPTIRIK